MSSVKKVKDLIKEESERLQNLAQEKKHGSKDRIKEFKKEKKQETKKISKKEAKKQAEKEAKKTTEKQTKKEKLQAELKALIEELVKYRDSKAVNNLTVPSNPPPVRTVTPAKKVAPAPVLVQEVTPVVPIQEVA